MECGIRIVFCIVYLSIIFLDCVEYGISPPSLGGNGILTVVGRYNLAL